MLLLVTILLVLVAAVTLLIGIFSDNLPLIFVSIGASALAAIVLAVLSQMNRRKGPQAAGVTATPEPVAAGATATAAAPSRPTPTAPAPRPTPAPAPAAAPVPAAAPAEPVAAAVATSSTTATAVADLPIENYDGLKVNEILPLLDELDLDELEAVAQHEESTKNRTTILNRIDDRMDQLEAEEAGAPTTVNEAVSDDVVAAAVETIEEVGEPVVAMAATSSGGAVSLPIANFDGLSEAEVIAAVQSLDADDLETVADYEEAHQNRDAVLDAIDDRLDVLEGIVPAPAAAPAPAPAPAPAAKKAAAKKSPAKKAAATTAVKKAATVSTTAKKAAAAPAKKATTTAASAKKAASAPAKKTAAPAPAKKATTTAAKKAATPAKKAATTTAKKATTATPKKAAPVKKATAAKKATKR